MPTDRERIEQWSLGYHLLKSYHDFFFKIYFNTTVVGIKDIPFDKSLIFAANHQNSLIDALAVLSARRWQLVYLARADVFKTSTLRKILTFLKILPVYRIRDGYQNLQLNDDVFRKTLDVLRIHRGIGILPEGNHFGQRRLRPLKKGIARIAFQAEDACEGKLNIHIIPVGLNYSNYVNFRSKMLIRFGKPIDISKYLDLYRQNTALAYNALIEELEVGMKAEMIQIDDEAYYDEYEMLREIFTPAYIKAKKLPKHQNSRFEVDKKMIAAVDKIKTNSPGQFQSLMDEVRSCSKLISETGLSSNSIQAKGLKLWGLLIKLPVLLITLPLFVYGFVNNIIPIAVTKKASNKIKDVQFISSIRLVVGMFIFPIMFIIQTLVFWAISGNGIYSLYYLLSLILGAIIAYHWRKYALKSFEDIKWVICKFRNTEKAEKLIQLNNSIYNTISPSI
ncbi:MAG: 1-acyl-sn-glycerol-3-phosphate acyltransferase [Bacteroidales bacterium]|nr:1-acyl-sn-glycerol-3-phosphate acyltransferase [Bacteroidales bacterium]